MNKCPKDNYELRVSEKNENLLVCDFCLSIFCINCGHEFYDVTKQCPRCKTKIKITKSYFLEIKNEDDICEINSSGYPDGRLIPLNRSVLRFNSNKIPDFIWAYVFFDSATFKWSLKFTKLFVDNYICTIKVNSKEFEATSSNKIVIEDITLLSMNNIIIFFTPKEIENP